MGLAAECTNSGRPMMLNLSSIDCFGLHIPYGGKIWRVETLADLVNDHKFAKVSSAKILCSILNYKSSNSPKFISPTVLL